MKFLDKLGLALFSLIVLIISILLCLFLFGWIDFTIITVAFNNILAARNGVYITLGILVVLMLLAIKCLFFPSYERKTKKSDDSEGILLQNDNGKLLITKGTIKNLVNSTVAEFKDIQSSDSEIEIDQNGEVEVNLTINVYKETIIKDVSAKLQNKIKESVKRATDLSIKQINIKVNDVEKMEENITEEKSNKTNTAE